MVDWKETADKTRDLLKAKKFLEATQEIQLGLEKLPNQVNLLTVATDLYRSSGDHSQSLEYAERLITHHPDNWNGYGRAAQDLAELKRFDQAQARIQEGLEKIPNQINILAIATDVFRASADHEKSLEYAERLIIYHSNYWIGYGRAAQDLMALKRFDQAKEKIQAGLKKFPKHVNLLTIAADIYRASGDNERSLEYTALLIENSAIELLAINRSDQAKEKIQEGLKKFPNRLNLLTIAADIYRASGNHEKSLEYAESLITHHPDHWIGYGRSAEALIELKKFDQAEIVIKESKLSDNTIFVQLQKKLERRKLVLDSIRSTGILPGRDYLTFCVAGNCQVSPMTQWLSSCFPYSQIHKLAPYHVIEKQSEIDQWINKARCADFVLMIPVRDSYGGFKFGSNYVRSLLGDKSKFISYPSFQLEVFYPFFGYAKKQNGAKLRGEETSLLGHKYGDYHDFLAIELSTKDQAYQEKFFKKAMEIENMTSFKSKVIKRLAVQSCKQFKKRYPEYIDLISSDIRNGILHTFNHPTGRVLNKIYEMIWRNGFGLDPDLFFEYRNDPLDTMKLPIPVFVSKAILSEDSVKGWRANSIFYRNHIHESINDYIEKVKTCISFYQRNPSIAEFNAMHKKLESASNFLVELNI